MENPIERYNDLLKQSKYLNESLKLSIQARDNLKKYIKSGVSSDDKLWAMEAIDGCEKTISHCKDLISSLKVLQGVGSTDIH